MSIAFSGRFLSSFSSYIISLTDEGIANMSWSEFVDTVKEPELIQYLKERRLYVNEEVTTEEDM